MRRLSQFAVLAGVLLASAVAAEAQFFSRAKAPDPAPAAAPEAKPVPPPAAKAPPCANPNALGIGRTVEIDTTGGPGFGLEQYKANDFLEPKEVVLTFDDGPWPVNTRAVLNALADHCTKATFFIIGKHASYHPELLKEVVTAGHTIGTHTWSHTPLKKVPFEKAKEDIEKGLSVIKLAMGAGAPAPFFRFPALQDPPELVTYLGTRNIAIFSMDLDSFDFKIKKSEAVVKSVMDKLEKKGKGIILMHDFQAGTARAIPQILTELKAKGYKVVHMKAKGTAQTLAEYDTKAAAEFKGPAQAGKPTSSIVKTVPTAN